VNFYGSIDKTASGYQCASWAAHSADKFGAPSYIYNNYCRATEDGDKGAWCFSSNPDKEWEYCKCPESYTGNWVGDFTDESDNDGSFSVSDDTRSCPSDKCWIYNSAKKQCDLTADCSTLTCSGKSMTISMNSDVLGTSVRAAGIYPTPTENETGQFVISCELGKCGMNYYTESDRLVPSQCVNYIIMVTIIGWYFVILHICLILEMIVFFCYIQSVPTNH